MSKKSSKKKSEKVKRPFTIYMTKNIKNTLLYVVLPIIFIVMEMLMYFSILPYNEAIYINTTMLNNGMENDESRYVKVTGVGLDGEIIAGDVTYPMGYEKEVIISGAYDSRYFDEEDKVLLIPNNMETLIEYTGIKPFFMYGVYVFYLVIMYLQVKKNAAEKGKKVKVKEWWKRLRAGEQILLVVSAAMIIWSVVILVYGFIC